jgi:hypothetical protein
MDLFKNLHPCYYLYHPLVSMLHSLHTSLQLLYEMLMLHIITRTYLAPHITVVIPKEGQVTRHASFLRYPSRSENKLFLWSDAQNISDLLDLEACRASLIWPSFRNTTVLPLFRIKATRVFNWISVRLTVLSGHTGT